MIPDEELDTLRRKWQEAFARPGHVTIVYPPLTRRVRLRLWLHGHVDEAAYWLVCHDHCDAARRLWQLFRMW